MASVVDDIDIEEHDLLDNPHIRSIFPDLSCLKMEPEDDEEEEVNQPAEEFSEHCENGVNIKEEKYDFDEELYGATDHIEFNQIHSELQPEMHFSNKIILGSKPSNSNDKEELDEDDEYTDLEVLVSDDDYEYPEDMGKEHMNTSVVVNNIETHLLGSGCYCHECGTLFPTPNALDMHNMVNHSLLVAVPRNIAKKSTAKVTYNVARKSTGSIYAVKNRNSARKSTGCVKSKAANSKLCHHCNLVFPDDTTLINHLYESMKFTCSICGYSFNKQQELLDHNAVHMKKEIKKEGSSVKKNSKTSQLKTKLVFEKDIKKQSEHSSVPKSVLFQCPQCKIYFLSCFVAAQHLRVCNGSKKSTPCKECKRKFRPNDSIKHKRQHEAGAQFRIFQVKVGLYERLLCKCPKCNVAFTELCYKDHQCGRVRTDVCSICRLTLSKPSMYEHLKNHKRNNLKAKDFLVIDYAPLKTKNIVKPKSLKLGPLSATASSPAKKMKLVSPVKKPVKTSKELNKISNSKIKLANLKIIYFCPKCKCYAYKCNRRKHHVSGQCLRAKKSKRDICKKCGLLFNVKAMRVHLACHEGRNMSVFEQSFTNIITLKRGKPVLPKYPQCPKCEIKFFSIELKIHHICGEDYQICRHCGDKYHDTAYEAHVEYHQIHKATEPKMSELIKRYESLNDMWNILFVCKNCDVATDDYDKAVEHSQDHFNGKVLIKKIKCYICNLKIDHTSWQKHSDLHVKKLTSKNFITLQYNPKNLLTEDWFEVFSRLPENQIQQITDKSLYAVERGVKMSLIKEGLPEFTVYCCNVCKISFESIDISTHLENPCSDPVSICKLCDMCFADSMASAKHNSLHRNGVKNEEFRIVSFMKSKQTVQPIKLKIRVPQKKLLLQSEKHKFSKIDGQYVFYKCEHCECCMHRPHNLKGHKCATEETQWECLKCRLLFQINVKGRHIEYHQQYADLNRKNTKVEIFNPEDVNYVTRKYKKRKPENQSVNRQKSKKRKLDNIEKRSENTSKAQTSDTITSAKIYKCECGIHYTSQKGIEKHQLECGDKEVSTKNCSKCGLLFAIDHLVTHLCKHHRKDICIHIEKCKKTNKNTIESPSNNTITSMETDDLQTQENSRTEDRTPKNRNKLRINLPKTSQPSDIKLFKCGECNVYWLNKNTCYKHAYKNHVPLDPNQYIKCKVCGLQFTLITLQMHMSKQHSKEFRLDQVLVEEYQPPVGNNNMKVSIYYAKSEFNVQSLQVTSSIE